MEIQRIWKEKYKIHSYEINFKGNATLPILCKFMQESAWHHAENLGVGFSNLLKNGLIWVLSQQLIEIGQFPKWGDRITIHTWPSGRERLAYIRDFKLFDHKENVIGKARTKWYALDINKKRPQNVDSHFNYNLDGVEQVFSHQLSRLKTANTNKISKSFHAGYSNLDVNKHVNNVQYIEWVLESFSLDFHKLNDLYVLEINFIAETFYDEQIAVYTEKIDDSTFIHSLFRNNDEKEVCRARTFWRKI